MSLIELHPLLKQIHVTSVALSIGGYLFRAALMLRDSPLLQTRAVRTVPHVIDTVLLTSAIALATNIRQYPFAQGWLTAKVVALVAYIVLGAYGLRYGRTKTARALFALGALLAFAYIVGVALTRSPTLGL